MRKHQRKARDLFRQSRKGGDRRRGRPAGDFSAKNQILRGAAKAFGQSGYAQTTVEDILQASDVSRRTFYKFFNNKEDLFGQIFDRAAELLLDAVRVAVADIDEPLEKIDAGIEAYLQVMAMAGPLARVILTEQYRPDTSFANRRKATVNEFRKIVEHEYVAARAKNLDPLLIGGLIAALDFVSVEIALGARDGQWDIERGKRVMRRMIGATLAQSTDDVPPLPNI